MSEEKINPSIDIRIIQLSRWQIPKLKGIFEDASSNIASNGDEYLAIGYFDMIKIKNKGGRNGQTVNPLLKAYQSSHRYIQGELITESKPDQAAASMLEDYTVQEMLIFTDIGEGAFEEEEIENFWKDANLQLFISLIHVDNESNIMEITKRIKEVFSVEGTKKNSYLYYYSFDYSGIVLFAKDNTMVEYLEKLFQLNYDNHGKEKLIRDSYSFYGLSKAKVKEYFDKIASGTYEENYLKGISGKFTATINVGIQNYDVYKEFLGEVKEVNRRLNAEIKEYGLLGRYDISLVNEDADLQWLIYIQYLLNEYTKAEGSYGEKEVFSTHETFIKIPNPKGFPDKRDVSSNLAYESAKSHLDSLCDVFVQCYKEKKELYQGSYITPVQAVKYSILSILKNRFAEDFVLCIYQSFCDFIQYLTEKLKQANYNDKEFDDCYSEYFRGLNSLVNSAMHSERQFIQATAFNAIIYDIPSKIMAFYVAMIDDMQGIISGESDKKYTFLLTPSFSNEIMVKIISYQKEKPPHDRILMVSINEESLYNPKAVLWRMAHEMAHFVGDEWRMRATRKKHIINSIVCWVLSKIIYKEFIINGNFFALIENIVEFDLDDEIFNEERMNYSENLLEFGIYIVNEFLYNTKIQNRLKEYINNIYLSMIKNNTREGEGTEKEHTKESERKIKRLNEYIACIIRNKSEKSFMEDLLNNGVSEENMFILIELIMEDIVKRIEFLSIDRKIASRYGEIDRSALEKLDKNVKHTGVGEITKGLISIYSEAFADIQMVLLLNITYFDYIEEFISVEKIDLKQVKNNDKNLTRMAMVTMVLVVSGLWKDFDNVLFEKECLLTENADKINELHGIVKERIFSTLNNISDQDLSDIKLCKNMAKSFIKVVDGEDGAVGSEVDIFMQAQEFCGQDKDNLSTYMDINVARYLFICLAKSLKHYKKKDKDIRALRKNVDLVITFKNTEEVLAGICEKLNVYKQKLYCLTDR